MIFFEKSACIFENNLILYTSRVRQAAKIKYMRKCRNWQTSKTKDLVIIAIVWVQVPSSALNNKTGTKQSVWSLSCCSKPKRALNPWFKVSPPARSARGMRSPGPHSVSAPLRSLQNRRPPDVLQPIFRTLSSALKWGKLNYTDFAQNCILDQKERTSL